MSCSLGRVSGDLSLVDRLEFHADQMPDRVVYTWLDDDGRVEQQFTFAQLACRARTLAERFSEHASPGERALLLYPHGLEFVAAFLGCLCAGVVAVPAYPPRRNRSVLRLTAIHRDAQPRLVLTSSQVVENLAGQFGEEGCESRTLVTDAIPTDTATAWKRPALKPESLAFIQYTSGSTGAPKGARISHGNIVANEISIQKSFEYSAQSTMISWLPMFHDMGLIGNVLQPLYTGFRSVLLSPVTFLREPIRWLRAISDHRGTTSGAPNFAYDHCVDGVTEEEKAALDLRSLTLLYNGAEPVRAQTLERFADAFAPCGFRREAFFPCYGMAETTLLASGGPPQRRLVYLPVRSGDLEAHRVALSTDHEPDVQTLVGCGRTAHGTRIVIVDPETRRLVPADTVGEIWVAGPSVAQGYWNRAEETEQTFRAHLADTGEGPFLRTGDLGFIRDGESFITGRIKDLIIIRGRNIYPHDVEATVERTLDFVAANTCAAFATTHDDGERLTLVIESDRAMVQTARRAGHTAGQRGGIPELDALVEQVRQAITDEFEVTPHAVVFVRPGTFPRTSSGKVQRRACRHGLEAGELEVVYATVGATRAGVLFGEVSNHTSTTPNEEDCRPLALTRHELCQFIQEQVTKYVRRQSDATSPPVPLDKPFSVVGLDSLGAASVGRAIEKRTGIRLTADDLYEYQTIRDLAAHIRQRQESQRHTPCAVICEQPLCEHPPGLCPQQRGTPPRVACAAPPGAACPAKTGGPGSTPENVTLARGHLDHFRERNRRIDVLRSQNLYFYETPVNELDDCWVQIDGHRMLMLSSYSYLGLIGHPEVNAAAKQAIDRFGTGAHGARLISGTTGLHRRLERALSAFLQADDAIVYNSGYVTNLATIAALVGPDDYVVGDELNHASIVDGCRFSGARFLEFHHNDVDSLRQRLQEAAGHRVLVVVDAVYSMEGDIADLPRIVAACRQAGAMLMVDEAHSLGVLGARGRGVQEHFALPPDAIDVKMGTLSKSTASCGGFIAGKREIISFLKHHARGFIFSVALPAPQVAAALKSLEILQREPERVARLRQVTQRYVTGLRDLGFRLPPTETPIVPILCDSEEQTLHMARRCREAGLFVIPILYPAVPRNAPRIRTNVMATHTDADVAFAVATFARMGKEVGLIE